MSQNPDTALEKVYHHYFIFLLLSFYAFTAHFGLGKLECTLLVKKMLSPNRDSCVLFPIPPLIYSMTLNG